MSDISTIGLGRMGSVLARCLLQAGCRVTVWNRSPAKAQPLARLGASAVDSVSAAVAASPVILVCIDNYETTQALFEAPSALRLLSQRTVVQLSTGTPKEASDAEAWFTSQGAFYLDGAILAGPEEIGTPATTILYAGRRETFERCRALLDSLGGGTRFVGEKIGSAAAIDMAWLSELYGALAGVVHGAVICEAEGVDLETYSSVFPKSDIARWMIDAIGKGDYSNPGATISVWNSALRHIRAQACDARINSEIPDFVAGILDRAEAAGLGQEHIAAMVKVLRRDGPP
jgi:3-hydroxyisobutyrate dehydrogenase-like beta-hydroxyacid dehydrogenase